MTIDLVITQPTSCDFPIWRNFLRHNREKFGKVIIVMAKSNGKNDYTGFLTEAMRQDDVLIRPAGSYIETNDWRDSAVKTALLNSDAEYVWFTEQDFFIANPSEFFAQVNTLINAGNQFIYVKEGGERIHPCCMIVKRSLIEKTRKDFGIIPDKSDHFGKFVADILAQKPKMQEIGTTGKDYFHMNGLTHNYNLIEIGQTDNVYQPGLFQLYNSYARMQDVPQDPRFINLSFKVDELLSPIVKFFRGK